MPTLADLHWRLLNVIPRRILSLFVVRGTLEGRFPPDLIARIRDRMNQGRFLWSHCVPIPESAWLQKRFAHPNAGLFRAIAERQPSELCVHAVDADFGSLKVVWIGMSADATLVLYEVFFPSLATLVLLFAMWAILAAIASLVFAGVSPWLGGSLAIVFVLFRIVRYATSRTHSELVRVIAAC